MPGDRAARGARRASPPIRLCDPLPAAFRRACIRRPGPSRTSACGLAVPPSAAF